MKQYIYTHKDSESNFWVLDSFHDSDEDEAKEHYKEIVESRREVKLFVFDRETGDINQLIK